MSFLLYLVLTPLALAGLGLSIFLALEIFAGFGLRDEEGDGAPAPPFVVVIPAHNEAASLAPVIANVQASLRAGDRILLVADNCTDETAHVARSAGAEVVERRDPVRRGKGYALQFALDQLRAAAPAIVVFTDADCYFAPGALQRVAAAAHAAGRPTQALYLMNAPADGGPRLKASAFAWAFMNDGRMRGLQRLFGVTRFTGAGFAAPWSVLANLNLASGEIVEDLALTMTLVRKGAPPMLVAGARVTSEFPTDDAALTRQAARWSIGSMRYAAEAALSALAEGVAKGRRAQIGAALDLMVPPIILLAGALCALVLAGLLAGLAAGAWGVFVLALMALVVAAAAIIAGWFRFGRKIMPPGELGGLLGLLASKFAVFGAKGRKSAQSWTPTRGGSDQ